MATASGPSAPPARLNLVNVFFWQIAGLVIGGLMPTSLLGLVLDTGLEPMLGEDGRAMFWAAVGFAPFTAALGGILGTIIGVYDRRPTLVSRRSAAKGNEPAPGS